MRPSLYRDRGSHLIVRFDRLACDVIVKAEAAFSGSDAVLLPVRTIIAGTISFIADL